MTIVWATPVVPSSPKDGGTIRIYQLLRGLARRHRVHLVALTNGVAEARDLQKLQDVCQSVDLFTLAGLSTPKWSVPWWHKHWKSISGPASLYYLPELHVRLDYLRGKEKADVVLLETLKMAGYRPLASGGVNGERRADNVILSRQNYEPAMARGMAEVAPSARERVMWRTSECLLTRTERRVARQFRFMTAVSEKEADILRRLAPWAEVAVVPNGADPILFAPVSNGPGDHIVAIVGTMEYPPNCDGARFFCQSIWPLVRASCPEARLRIIGNGAARRLPELVQVPGVELREPEADIAAELAGATVVAVPIRAGSGTRIKILEAMAAGKPVVSTTIGCEGLSVVPGHHLIVIDEPTAFAGQVVELLRNHELRRTLGANGRKLVEQRYNWQSAVEALEAFCERVTGLSSRGCA